MQQGRVEGTEDIVLDADASRSLPIEGVSLESKLGDNRMNTDHSCGELIEARQDVLKGIAADHYLSGLPRLIPHIVVRAEEDRRSTDVIKGILLDEDRARGVDEDTSGAVVPYEVVSEDDTRCTAEVLHADASLGMVVGG